MARRFAFQFSCFLILSGISTINNFSLILEGIAFADGGSPDQHCQSYDLRHYWPDEKMRDQGYVGSCHSFASAALVEAELFRRTGKNYDLSERDLFEQHFLKTTLSDHAKDTQAKQIWGVDPDYMHGEGSSSIKDDFEIIKKNGLCFESAYPYDYSSRALPAYRLIDDLRKQRGAVGDVASCNEGWGNWWAVNLGLVQDAAEILIKDSYDALIQNMNPPQNCLLERKALSGLINSWNFKTVDFESDTPWTEKKNLILNLLSQGKPIEASFKGYGKIKKQQAPAPDDGHHAVLIVGFDCSTHEFIIRNSWGETGYDRVKVGLGTAYLDEIGYVE